MRLEEGTITGGGDLSWPLRRSAELFGSSVAIIDGERCLTYAELARRVDALAPGLAALGIEPGSRVGLLGANSLAHVECVLGVPAAGRVLVDLNFRLAEEELVFIAADCEIELLIVDGARLEVARALRARCPSIGELVLDAAGEPGADYLAYEDLLAHEPVEAQPPVEERTLAAISYTGGTTGAPKGVMLSHGNLLANARHNLIATGHTPTDRWLHVCPMFHVAGTANVFACTWVGAKQIILPGFDARLVADTIAREKITHTVLVPTMISMLLDELDQGSEVDHGSKVDQDGSEVDLTSLRHIQYAASPIAPALQKRLLERFDFDIVQFYGMTEAAPTVSSLSAEDHRRGLAGESPHASRLRSIGVPVVGVEAEVRGPDGDRLPAGEIGELWVRGPNVMLGYWNRPDATHDALTGGWYRTGDAARRDEDGYLYLVDRLKDMIISGGENVYSVEVEAALLEHKSVIEAAVFGIPDAQWGEAVHAVVCLRAEGAATVEELVSHCRKLIAGYKVPRLIELRTDPLPKSGAGKVLKHRLREPFWASHDRQIN